MEMLKKTFCKTSLKACGREIWLEKKLDRSAISLMFCLDLICICFICMTEFVENKFLNKFDSDRQQ